MKIYRNFLLIAIIIFMFSACAPQPTAVSSSNSTEAATPAASASTKTDDELEALIFEKVHDKHTLDFFLPQNKTAGQWSSTLH